MAELTITEYTDPGCPFAWSAEPYRWRLQWLYGDQLDWQVRMVGLAEDGSVYEDKGFTAERMSEGIASSPQQHHMPMDTALRPRMAGTIPACRAVVAVRRHRPELEWAMLRALRVLHFSGHLLDEPATLSRGRRARRDRPRRPGGMAGRARDRGAAAPGHGRGAHAHAGRAGAGRTSSPPPRRAIATRARHMRWCATATARRCRSRASSRWPPTRSPWPTWPPTRRGARTPTTCARCWSGPASRWPRSRSPRSAAPDLADARERLGRVADEAHLGFDGLWHLNGVAAVA